MLDGMGWLPLFLLSFLQDCHSCVHLSSVFSALCQQENGVPQGSVLGVTLFTITGLLMMLQFPEHGYNRTSLTDHHQSSLASGSAKAKTQCEHVTRLRSLHPPLICFSATALFHLLQFLGLL
jgi:hypothetical protein